MIRKSMAFWAVLLITGVIWGQPIEKTGNCPQLTRYDAPQEDDWLQFPIKPADRNTWGTIQNSLDPQESINCLSVPSGLKAQIVASHLTPGDGEGMAYLQYFTFDERGRVWALDVRDYPYPIAQNKATGGQGRILIFEDTDGDGAMDNFKEFYKGLVIPTSLALVKGGVVVTATPQIFFIPNNNDVGGTPEVLFSTGDPNTTGFDTHGQLNSLMYSLDNWIYGQTGYNGCNYNGTNCGGGRVWRFRHTKIGHSENAFQVWTTGPANAAGIGQMENGEIFQSAATVSIYSSHSIRRGQSSIGLVPNRADFYPPTNDLYLWEGGNNGTSVHTAVSGHDFYTARLLPLEYNKRLYVCEGATKHCRQDDLEVSSGGGQTGSTWKVNQRTQAASRIIGSTDAWFAPLKVRTGPDGGLWVVDWYNYLFLHNPASPGLGQTGAWRNELRQKEKSHIYRIIPEDGNVDPYPALDNQQQTLAALGHSNFTWRLLAQRKLIYGGANAGLLDTLEMILDNSRYVDEMDNDPIVTHAVWVLEGLGELEDNPSRWGPKMQALLKHPAWATRRNVLMAMPRTSATSQAIVDECAVNDDHGHVRLQAMVALEESPNVSGETALWTTFDGVDNYITSARQGAGVGTSQSRPCTPDYDAEGEMFSLSINSAGPAIASYKLQFNQFSDYIELLPHGQLNSGKIHLYNISGKEVFQSSYDSEARSWSNSKIKGLNQGAYTYVFKDSKGSQLSGRLNVLK